MFSSFIKSLILLDFFPEIFLFCLILFLLIFNLSIKTFVNNIDFVKFNIFFIVPFLLFLISFLILLLSWKYTIFVETFATTPLDVVVKILILIFTILVLLGGNDYFKFEKFQLLEFVILILFAVLGMFLLISANDMMLFTWL